MSSQSGDEQVLIEISVSQPRRWMGIIALAALGVLLFSLALAPTGGLVRLVFLAFAIVAVLAADRLRRATADRIELTRTELRTGSGRTLALLSNIKSVERGALAFKPSNGFLLRLHEPDGRGWEPGLWWKRGRMVGIGGVVNSGQARATAELIVALQHGYDLK